MERQLHELGDDAGHRHLPLGTHRRPAEHREPKTFVGASGSPLGKTILQRAYASNQGNYSNFPIRYIHYDLVKSYTEINDFEVDKNAKDKWWAERLSIKNAGMGIQVQFEKGKVPDGNSPKYNVNVEVCRDEGTGANSLLETNCRKYMDSTGTKTVWKPAGLMQQYKDKMYFGAFGYLYLPDFTDANNQRDGGVLRAQMQSIDSEITETGAFPDDPYGMQAKQGVNSGTINYLNKFGQSSGRYKTYDPVSEMYAEAVKYFKAMQPTAPTSQAWTPPCATASPWELQAIRTLLNELEKRGDSDRDR